jgi:hypothetical protein
MEMSGISARALFVSSPLSSRIDHFQIKEGYSFKVITNQTTAIINLTHSDVLPGVPIQFCVEQKWVPINAPDVKLILNLDTDTADIFLNNSKLVFSFQNSQQVQW